MKRKNISLLFIEIHIWLQSIISSKVISNYNKFIKFTEIIFLFPNNES